MHVLVACGGPQSKYASETHKKQNLKYKAVVLAETHILLVSNPLLPVQRHLDQFSPSEPNPLLPIQRHLGNIN